MILRRAIFYKLAEMALNSFFDSILKNFNKIDFKDGINLSIDNIKPGDTFYKITYIDVYDEREITFYGVKIFEIYKDSGYIGFEYLYSFSDNRYIGFLYKDVRGKFSNRCKNDDVLHDLWYSFTQPTFNKIFNELKPFMSPRIDCLYLLTVDNLVGWR